MMTLRMADVQRHHDVIIVGDGVHGLCAAHTFLSVDPFLSLLIIDSKSSVGGVWAKEQLYPGLRANNLQGYYEFSDFPMLNAGLDHLAVRERSPLWRSFAYLYVRVREALRPAEKDAIEYEGHACYESRRVCDQGVDPRNHQY